MPPGKKQQNTAMLFGTLITFVTLFIIVTAVAVVFYVQTDKNKAAAAKLQSEMDELATSLEIRKIGSIVGSKTGRETYLGKMVENLDAMAILVTGQLPEDTSAEGKLADANSQTEDILKTLEKVDVEADGETVGLVRMMEKLVAKLETSMNTGLELQQKYIELEDSFDDAMKETQEKEQVLLDEKEKYAQQVKDITNDYDKLKALVNQTAEQQVQTLMNQLDRVRAENKDTKKELLKTQAELKLAQNRIKNVQDKLASLVPPPDSEVMAFEPDGKVILIDDQAKIVHLNIGSEEHVYRGLTFSIYEKNVPIPRDGRGKAEIEVFNVNKNISAARIIRSEIKRPIVLDDIAANLIWDRDEENVFVIAGDFDLNNDGRVDYNATEKLKALVEKWGGRVGDDVTVKTDFIILGSLPQIRRKPTFEAMEIDPMAMDKYNDSLEKLSHYKKVRNEARDLSIPVFNIDRFLDFIGYKTQSSKPGAF